MDTGASGMDTGAGGTNTIAAGMDTAAAGFHTIGGGMDPFTLMDAVAAPKTDPEWPKNAIGRKGGLAMSRGSA